MSAQVAPAPASAGPSGGVSSGGSAGSPPSPSPTSVTQNPGSPASPGGGQSLSAAQSANEVPGAKPGETPAETVQRLKSVQRINGKDVEIEASVEELWAAKRREAAVQENAKKMAAARKAHEQDVLKFQEHVRRRQEDPFFELRGQEGFNELDFLQQRMHHLLTEQNKDPRDLELGAKDRRIRELEHAAKQQQTEAQRAQEHAEENRQLAQLGAKFNKALKMGGLPEDDLTLDIMAKAYFTAEEEGDFDLSETELAAETRKLMTSSLDNCADKMTGDALLDAFPKIAKKLHEALVARYKRLQGGQQTQQPGQVPTANVTSRQEEAPRRQTEREQYLEMEKASGRRILRGV